MSLRFESSISDHIKSNSEVSRNWYRSGLLLRQDLKPFESSNLSTSAMTCEVIMFFKKKDKKKKKVNQESKELLERLERVQRRFQKKLDIAEKGDSKKQQ